VPFVPILATYVIIFIIFMLYWFIFRSFTACAAHHAPAALIMPPSHKNEKTPQEYAMNATDLRILHYLQQNARIPMPALAEKVGLSEPACYRRVRHLRQNGCIEREAAIVKPKTMGWPLTMMVLVNLERDNNAMLDQFITRMHKQPEVIDCWYVTGGFDMVLYVIAKDMEAYDDFTQRVLHQDDIVKRFRTLVTLRHAKKMGAIPPARETPPAG
jgi:Lrp/AsnC family leucine-responsive transcriptional regulator